MDRLPDGFREVGGGFDDGGLVEDSVEIKSKGGRSDSQIRVGYDVLKHDEAEKHSVILSWM